MRYPLTAFVGLADMETIHVRDVFRLVCNPTPHYTLIPYHNLTSAGWFRTVKNNDFVPRRVRWALPPSLDER